MKKLPKFKKKIKHIKSHLPVPKLEEPAVNTTAPRITTETIAEHREEVLGSARKYIYPLQHSKHRIVLISTGLFIAAVVAFFSYSVVALYQLKDNSSFLYGVTQIIPFPVAKAGPKFVAYENYLYELRHYMHYYQTQQKLDFKSEAGKLQLADYKKRALDKVVNDAYVKILADKNKLSVSNRQVDDQIEIVRNQNRLGSSDKSFEDVLKENFGWSISDFKRSLKQQLLAQRVVAHLDTETVGRAAAALNELKSGADFGETAKKYSDDSLTKESGGEIGGLIDKTNRDIAPQTVAELFKLQPGQYSEVINTGYTLEIVKVIDVQGDKVHAAHILFSFKDISTYINDQKDKQKARLYIKL